MLKNTLNNYSRMLDEYLRIFFEQVKYKLRNDDMKEIVWRIGQNCLQLKRGSILLKLWHLYTKTRVFMQKTQAKSRLSYIWHNAVSLSPCGYHVLITTKLEISNYYEIDLSNRISHNYRRNTKSTNKKIKIMKHFNLLFCMSCTEYFLLPIETEECKSVMINSKLLKLIVPGPVKQWSSEWKFILAP